MLTFSLGAQEAVEVKPPVKTAPPASKTSKSRVPVKPSTNRKPTESEMKAATAAPTRTRRRVVLPPNAARSTGPTARPTGRLPSARPAVPQNSKSTAARVVRPTIRAVPTSRPAVTRVMPKVFTENITIQLQGSVHDGPPLDLSLTGVGPIFQADVVTGDKFTILSHQYSVIPNDCGYKVEYNIGIRLRMEMARNGQNTSYEFRDVSLSGTVIAKEGEKVVVSKNGDRELSLTLGKAKKK